MRLRSMSVLVLMAVTNLAHAQCENSESNALSAAEALLNRSQTEAINTELAAIRAASRGESNSVFFIDIFGGLMPIPNRFVPFARSPGEFHE